MANLQNSSDLWLTALDPKYSGHQAAIEELRRILVSALHRVFTSAEVVHHIEDFVQDTLIRINDNLGSYRGNGSFVAWAISIAIHVAYSDLRRARWRGHSLDQIDMQGIFVPELATDSMSSPERQSAQLEILGMLRNCIAENLTERQRQVLLAELAGMPLATIAEELDTTENNIYKLDHDARMRLKKILLYKGINSEYIKWAFDI
jgi:RNA polymerase sigma-70 factor (ECF subfamily)